MEDIKEKTADEDMTKMFIGCDKLEPLPKTADEMLSEIGYELEEPKYNLENLLIYRAEEPLGSSNICIKKEIIFNLKEKTVKGQYGMLGNTALGIDMDLLQAINKKCKELNWLGDE